MGDNRAVIVRNVPEDATDQTLKQYFSKAGTVDCTFIDVDESVGFVVYRDSQNAIDAVKSLHGQILTGQTLSVKLATKEERTHIASLIAKQKSPTLSHSHIQMTDDDAIDELAEKLSVLDSEQLDRLFLKMGRKLPTVESKPQRVFALTNPKLPPFSGDESSKTNELSYHQWHYYVKSFIRDDAYTTSQIMDAIRGSVRGTAANVFLNISEDSTPEEVIKTFDRNFGNVLKLGRQNEQFYTAQQNLKDKENIVAWGCRVQKLFVQIKDKIKWTEEEANMALRDRFWYGLRDKDIKTTIQHRFDRDESFEELFTAARAAEYENNLMKSSKEDKKPIIAQQAATSSELSQVLTKVDSILFRIGSVEKRLTQLESKGQSTSENQNEAKTSKKFRGQQQPRNKNVTCTRCKRRGHEIGSCWAKKDIDGNPLN